MSQGKQMPDETRRAILRDLAIGASVSEIVEAYGVSRRTVFNLKKSTETDPGAECATDGPASNASDDTMEDRFSSMEKKYTDHLKDVAERYEDPEEGWHFHLEKNDIRRKTSGCWWCGIAYPESVTDGWIKKIADLGFAVAVSPLHDKDTWSHDSPAVFDDEGRVVVPQGERYVAGDAKKAHWHFVLISEKSCSARDINSTIRKITNGPYLDKCRSLRGYVDYFTHERDPEKYQGYDKAEIVKMGGFHVELNKYEKGRLLQEILQEIREKRYTSLTELLATRWGDSVEGCQVIAGWSGVIRGLLRENFERAKPQKSSLTNEGFLEGIRALKGDDKNGRSQDF